MKNENSPKPLTDRGRIKEAYHVIRKAADALKLCPAIGSDNQDVEKALAACWEWLGYE